MTIFLENLCQLLNGNTLGQTTAKPPPPRTTRKHLKYHT
ncbi:unnamed protein product [Brassica rapa subsp. trilocularis]